MPNTYDAIVIGGGHNGLISAGFFAKGGARTVVLEARPTRAPRGPTTPTSGCPRTPTS
jgi:glycine/D-amino acid oxidase-like deaminating enzyme